VVFSGQNRPSYVLYYIYEEIKSRLNFGTFATIHSDCCVFLFAVQNLKI